MNNSDTWLPRGTFNPLRYRPGGIGNWSGHLPFARDLVESVKPQLLVELGTHFGESYFGFCQAVAAAGNSCKCYAVDSWVGEQHATFYDERVYEEVSAYNQTHYRSFSFLLRKTFDEARDNFAADSIDILHIDGLHTYGAVRHDFHNWLPAVKPGGIVLLHDSSARHFDFGVWKLWDELEQSGEHFAFLHNWGLGVFRKPGGPAASPLLTALFNASAELRDHIRHYYALSARSLEYDHIRALAEESKGPAEVLKVYPEGANGYSGDLQFESFFPTKEWQHQRLDVPSGSVQGGLRIDIAEHSGVIDVAGVAVSKAVNGAQLFKATGADELVMLTPGGDLTLLPQRPGAEYCRYLSTGSDPQLFLKLDPTVTDQPLMLDLWVRVDAEVTPLLSYFADFQKASASSLSNSAEKLNMAGKNMAALNAEHAGRELELTAELERLKLELTATHEDLRRTNDATASLRTELALAVSERNAARASMETLVGQLHGAEAGLAAARLDVAEQTAEHERLRIAYQQLNLSVQELQDSRSELEETASRRADFPLMRLTHPLRRLLGS